MQPFTASRLQAQPCGSRTQITSGQNAQSLMSNAGLRLPATPHRRALGVQAQALNKGGPPDVPKPRDQPKGGKEWLQTIFSRFGPVKERASNTTVLDFEKPLVELDNRIKEVSF